ncbi:MAG: septum formation initiator family protein [Sphingomonadales bacterium]|nr:septum formation initiator family protein [Sphingomonadales bacterium]
MKFLEHIKYRMSQALWPAIFITVLFYFVFHAVQGNYGLLALRDLDRSLSDIQVVAEATASERKLLETKTSRLTPGNIDPELLGERAREVLGFVSNNERVILIKPSTPAN